MAQTEDELLAQVAQRPDDRSLRLVYSDWLQEQGDPRGEVIALWARGHLSLTERRRLQRLTDENAARWLGQIAAIADVPRCRWEGGFPTAVVLAPRGAVTWEPFIGDPRWGTVRSLVFPVSLVVNDVVPLLYHRVFAGLERLEAAAGVLGQLRAPSKPAFGLKTVALASWATFQVELPALLQPTAALPCPACGRVCNLVDGACAECGRVLEADALKDAKRLELATSEFVNPIVAREIRAALGQDVVARSRGLTHFDELRLLAPYGVMEGVAAWLTPGPLLERLRELTWAQGRAWAVAFGDVLFRLERMPDGLFRRLSVDLTGPEGTLGLGQRLATVAGVLVLLAAAHLVEVELLLPDGARLRPNERDALRAAVRRLGSVQQFRIAGLPVTP